jgi:hypothetical protein
VEAAVLLPSYFCKGVLVGDFHLVPREGEEGDKLCEDHAGKATAVKASSP